MAGRWLTGLNTATVQHHNHESFIFTNSTASMWLYKRTVGVCQHTLSESISRCYCFFSPSHHNSFLNRDDRSPSPRHWHICLCCVFGLWQSVFVYGLLAHVRLCVRGWHALCEVHCLRLWEEDSTDLSVNETGHICIWRVRAAMFVCFAGIPRVHWSRVPAS